MIHRLRDECGLAGSILVGVIAWALGAVLMLSITLTSAQQIDNRVRTIRTEVSPIDKDLDSVELAAETNRVAQEILAAAKPLSGQADQILAPVGTIKANAEQIDGKVKEINGTVNSIDGNAKAINKEVLSINGTAKAINGTAKSINATVKEIDGNVSSIAGSVNGIHGSLSAVLDVARQIRGDHGAVQGFGSGGIAAINRRADAIIGIVNGIKADTGNVLASVGKIEKSAKSIDSKTGPTGF